MPNIKSAKKRVLVNKTKAARNKSANSALKTAIKKANAAAAANSPDKEAAVKFMQFCHTDAQLNEFTSMTSLIKPFNYDTTSEQTTSFGQSIADMQANSKVALPMADAELFRYASNDFWIVYWMQCKYDANKSAGLSLVSILNMKDGNNPIYDAQSYWKGIMEYRENERWVKYKDVLN